MVTICLVCMVETVTYDLCYEEETLTPPMGLGTFLWPLYVQMEKVISADIPEVGTGVYAQQEDTQACEVVEGESLPSGRSSLVLE